MFVDQFGSDPLYAFCRQTVTKAAQVHGRMFAPMAGIQEDPATGSANGPLGAYLVKNEIVNQGIVTEIVSEQGFEMGRPSLLEIEIEQEDGEISSVKVGGRCVLVGEGRIV